ncbi:hypothetical protein CCUS01_03836 [Colletotrichum cuscutae]|uniref:Uncharacterized protein n=1 Tax=Colletotrichum cuscutae TaxID=1209917 RepID=A0AAI9VGH0_9PEZI|nr:hypothetical protein CCUS01_03836 [Colletotrichum cuscutae]
MKFQDIEQRREAAHSSFRPGPGPGPIGPGKLSGTSSDMWLMEARGHWSRANHGAAHTVPEFIESSSCKPARWK